MVKELRILEQIEARIEECYIKLAELEIDGKFDSLEYQEYFSLIVELTNKEKDILKNLHGKDLEDLKKFVKKKNPLRKSSTPIMLGHLVQVYYFRILDMLDSISDDDYLDYASTLYYDINQLLFAFLNVLISNDYYSSIREDLIYYKYHLIFVHSDSESDFLLNRYDDTIRLKSNNFRTNEMPAYPYVDKAILVFEGADYIERIMETPENFQYHSNYYSNAVIDIINILARLTLCDSDTLPYLEQDFNGLLEEDLISLELKNLIHEMLTILEQLKSKIGWAR